MERYLLLGGNGYLGKYIAEKLAEDNKVVIADRNVDERNNTKNITFINIDFIKCKSFDKYLENIDYVIHLISTIGPNDNIDDIEKEISDNVFPTIRLLNSIVKSNVKKIVFLSSGGTIYGMHDKNSILEDEKKSPICNYGIIKDSIEQYMELFRIYKGLNYSIIRLGNPYSEKTKNGRKQGIIPIIIDQIFNCEPITVWGDGSEVRDYIYIDDAVDAIIKIIMYDGREKIFNVGTGNGYSVNELLEIVSNYLKDYKINVEYIKNRICDVNNNVLNISRINKELNWYPKVSLEEGILKVIEKKKAEEKKYD